MLISGFSACGVDIPSEEQFCFSSGFLPCFLSCSRYYKSKQSRVTHDQQLSTIHHWNRTSLPAFIPITLYIWTPPLFTNAQDTIVRLHLLLWALNIYGIYCVVYFIHSLDLWTYPTASAVWVGSHLPRAVTRQCSIAQRMTSVTSVALPFLWSVHCSALSEATAPVKKAKLCNTGIAQFWRAYFHI